MKKTPLLKKKLLKRLLALALILFLFMNLVAYMHAYKFTHFSPAADARSDGNQSFSFAHKLKLLVTGVDNPRPVN